MKKKGRNFIWGSSQFNKDKEMAKIYEKETNARQILDSVEEINRRDFFRGLTFETTCRNRKCVAFNKVILIPKGYKKFNIAKEVLLCKCPKC